MGHATCPIFTHSDISTVSIVILVSRRFWGMVAEALCMAVLMLV